MRSSPFLATLALAAVCALVAPDTGAAQVITPSFLAPTRTTDVGVYLADGFGAGGLVVEGIWRRSFGAFDLGLRAGVGDSAEDAVLLLGADYRNPLELDLEVEGVPVLLAVTGGAQLAVGGGSALGVDAGLTVGSTFRPEGLSVTPYLHPRIALVRGVQSGLGLAVLADLGVDLELPSSLVVRLGLGFGSHTADFGVGLAWR